MNRRNVLGNKIEESKTMWVVLTGIFVSALQFVIYHFAGEGWLGLLLSGACILVGGIAVHLITGEQEELFAYQLIPCAFSGSMGLLIPYLGGTVFPESGTALIGCLLAWLIPVLYACIFSWAEGSSAMGGFASFYKKTIIFFYIVYFGIIIYGAGFRHRLPMAETDMQLIPFATFAAYVDGLIKGTVASGQFVEFIVNRVVLFIPYGFFIAMVGRKLHGLIRLALLAILPVLVELLQFLFRWNSCDMDDFIFSFLGGLIGMMCFLLFNTLFQKFTGKNFDGSEIARDYYGRKI